MDTDSCTVMCQVANYEIAYKSGLQEFSLVEVSQLTTDPCTDADICLKVSQHQHNDKQRSVQSSQSVRRKTRTFVKRRITNINVANGTETEATIAAGTPRLFGLSRLEFHPSGACSAGPSSKASYCCWVMFHILLVIFHKEMQRWECSSNASNRRATSCDIKKTRKEKGKGLILLDPSITS